MEVDIQGLAGQLASARIADISFFPIERLLPILQTPSNLHREKNNQQPPVPQPSDPLLLLLTLDDGRLLLLWLDSEHLYNPTFTWQSLSVEMKMVLLQILIYLTLVVLDYIRARVLGHPPRAPGPGGVQVLRLVVYLVMYPLLYALIAALRAVGNLAAVARPSPGIVVPSEATTVGGLAAPAAAPAAAAGGSEHASATPNTALVPATSGTSDQESQRSTWAAPLTTMNLGAVGPVDEIVHLANTQDSSGSCAKPYETAAENGADRDKQRVEIKEAAAKNEPSCEEVAVGDAVLSAVGGGVAPAASLEHVVASPVVTCAEEPPVNPKRQPAQMPRAGDDGHPLSMSAPAVPAVTSSAPPRRPPLRPQHADANVNLGCRFFFQSTSSALCHGVAPTIPTNEPAPPMAEVSADLQAEYPTCTGAVGLAQLTPPADGGQHREPDP
eukprot:GHVT01097619.1.p1 GENE.GHVT01097619.1~~GHVT01097619.1.p1  ORF type:complete len:441 (-),score=99.60 GHVT01097619.1:815-2137(-)